MKLREVVNTLIEKFNLGDKSERIIAEEIGISKQLLNNFRNKENKITTPENYYKLYQWARNRGEKNINLEWIMGISETQHIDNTQTIKLSQEAFNNIERADKDGNNKLLSLILESDLFYKLVVGINDCKYVMQDFLFNNIEKEFLVFKLQNHITDLVDEILDKLNEIKNLKDDERTDYIENYRNDPTNGFYPLKEEIDIIEKDSEHKKDSTN